MLKLQPSVAHTIAANTFNSHQLVVVNNSVAPAQITPQDSFTRHSGRSFCSRLPAFFKRLHGLGVFGLQRFELLGVSSLFNCRFKTTGVFRKPHARKCSLLAVFNGRAPFIYLLLFPCLELLLFNISKGF